MDPALVDKGQIFLLGFSFFGDPFQMSRGWTDEEEIAVLWRRFTTYVMENGDRLFHVLSDNAVYELHTLFPETRVTGEFEVFVGIEVDRLEHVPVEMSVKILPPASYAVFALSEHAILSDWPQQIENWLAETGFERAYSYDFQRYDEEFRRAEHMGESILDIYVPIKGR